MFGIETLSGNAQAAVLVGLVLVEAFLLYVGYGWLESQVGPSFKRVLQGRCAVMDMLLRRCTVDNKGGPKQ
ncbi:DUF7512 family protein [Salinibaculum rarum]|uniref:DUF7512 family protein n=1 Tax=Salinibaculum rarum TaxID=3058903 RepID=UPI0026600DD7|nr:hypothetical protein [Salinibaculum sp. KK48]